jgi:hypothetical protein
MKSEIGTEKSLCHQDNILQQLWNKEIVSQALNDAIASNKNIMKETPSRIMFKSSLNEKSTNPHSTAGFRTDI